MKTAQEYTAEALDKLNAGFPTKAAKKKAAEQLSRAYELISEKIRHAHYEVANARWPYESRFKAGQHSNEEIMRGDNLTEAGRACVCYWNETALPSELHHYREEKHREAAAIVPGAPEDIAQLVEIRKAVKAAEVLPARKAEENPRAEMAQKTISEIMEKRRAQYAEALDLGRIFGGLRVTANVHQVINQYGTVFLRVFYFLNGKFTPLAVIVAAADTLEREKKGNAA